MPPPAYTAAKVLSTRREIGRGLSQEQDFSEWDLPPWRLSTSYECRVVFYQVRLEVRAAVMSVFPLRWGWFLTMEVFWWGFLCRTSFRLVSYDFLRFFFSLSFLFLFFYATFLMSRLSQRQNNFFGKTCCIQLILQISFFIMIYVCFT